MKNRSIKSSLNRVTGKSESEIISQEAQNQMMLVGTDSPNRRSIVIEQDRIEGGIGTEEAFEIVTDKIAKVIDNRREEVANALIVTGSPISVRGYTRKRFNAAVQNRLVDPSADGIAFRQYMTVLVGAMYGKSLVNDGFFRTGTEDKSGATGFENPWQQNSWSSNLGLTDTEPSGSLLGDAGMTLFGAGDNILPLTTNSDGGVDKSKSDTDWGSILSGSAQVIGSLGGVIGLFTGGSPTVAGNSVLDTYSQPDTSSNQTEQQKKRKKRIWVIVIALVVVAIVVTVIVIAKNKDND